LQVEIKSQPSKKGLKHQITQWLINAVAIVLVARWVRGVELQSSGTEALLTVLGASAVLGLLNMLLKPFLLLVTLPINILTLGLFTLVINGAVLALTATLVPDLHISGFWPSVIGALVLSIISLILNALFNNFSMSLKIKRGGIE
jgi:putative membrane protein